MLQKSCKYCYVYCSTVYMRFICLTSIHGSRVCQTGQRSGNVHNVPRILLNHSRPSLLRCSGLVYRLIYRKKLMYMSKCTIHLTSFVQTLQIFVLFSISTTITIRNSYFFLFYEFTLRTSIQHKNIFTLLFC